VSVHEVRIVAATRTGVRYPAARQGPEHRPKPKRAF
jgi:hypothetical protein